MIATKEEIKSFLPADTEITLEQIDLFLPVVEDYIKTYTGRDFSLTWPPALKVVAAKMIVWDIDSFNGKLGMKSESIGSYNYSANADKGYPEEILLSLNQYRKIKAVG